MALLSLSKAWGVAPWLLLLSGFPIFAAPSEPQTKSDLAGCKVPELKLLKYPTAALTNRIMGTVSLQFTVDATGKAGQFKSKSHPLLVIGAVEALRPTRFDPDCTGKTIEIKFAFILDITLHPKSEVKRLSPTEYEVVEPAPVFVVDTTCPLDIIMH